ncbi:hypothetical protein C0991_011335, partial [Blastosporella zonata]
MSEGTSKSVPQSRWTIAAIQKLVQETFNKRACLFQIKIAMALYEGKDVVGCAATGAGKTLSFWIPHLMSLADGKKDVLTFVVTPLNILGKQNERMLAGVSIMAVALTGDNANEQTFKSIENGKYSVVVINPKLLMGHKNVKQWWSKADMMKKILHFIFDEGHCISQWGSFQKDYKRVGEL